MKRFNSQNIFTTKVSLYNVNIQSFSFRSKEPLEPKIIGGFTIEAKGNHYEDHGSAFKRPALRILDADLSENYTDEYTVDFSEKGHYKELEYNAEVVNDSRAFLLHDFILGKKPTVDDKELLDRFGSRDESFEEEIEYMVRIKETYEEYYKY